MLTIEWTTEEPTFVDDQVLAVPLCADHEPAEIETRFGTAVKKALVAARFAGKPGETFAFTRTQGEILQRVVFVGTGRGLVTAEDIRVFGHDIVRVAQSVGARTILIDLRWTQGGPSPWSDDGLRPLVVGSALAQGLELGTYAYERFLSEDRRKPQTVERVCIWSSTSSPSEGTVRGQTIAQAVALARDLANGPGELVTPSYLAEQAREIVDRNGGRDVSLTVLERSDCEARSMGCFLGVAKGSDEPPKFIHLTYRPKGASKGRVALIGKGVTFDSGGFSLKPTDGMLDMKLDMSGAAAVLGAFEGAVRLGVAYELHVIVAATENMIGGHAYRLGDVLRASNGTTVEVNNTDAEGRLTLADALVYAAGLQPDVMIDFATLTGACIVALGPKIAGVMTPDDRLAADWMAAAERTGETMWRLPLPENLKEQLKSNIADMKNTGERWGGALTAGLFLSEFTEGRRWMHVDIAGPAMASKPWGVTTAGGSGFPVASILELLCGELDLG
jgi:leucyl aminopeptidase